MRARIGEQGECLVIETKARFASPTIEIDDSNDGAIRSDEMLVKIFERMLRGRSPRPVPAEPPRFAVGICLAGDGASSLRAG